MGGYESLVGPRAHDRSGSARAVAARFMETENG